MLPTFPWHLYSPIFTMTAISPLLAFFRDKFTAAHFSNTTLSPALHAFTSAIFSMGQIDQVAFVQLGEFFSALLFFHVSEFVLAIIIHGPSRVNSSSLLISKPYVIAMICGLIEYSIETIFVPKMKTHWWVNYTGLVMVVTGEVIRKSGMLTAWSSFTHDIKKYLRHDHELVTYGIYRYMRHPGYSGFFIWSIGTQVTLCNPFCIVAYAVVTWRFFRNRILYEEFFLRQFFGHRYIEYAGRVPSGIPFIR